jgi:hypothetical protein
MPDDLLDDGEATVVIRKFLGGWMRKNLEFLTTPKTNIGDLKTLRSIPRRVSYEGGKLRCATEDEQVMLDEVHYGSTRWPALAVYDAIDAHLLARIDEAVEAAGL